LVTFTGPRYRGPSAWSELCPGVRGTVGSGCSELHEETDGEAHVVCVPASTVWSSVCVLLSLVSTESSGVGERGVDPKLWPSFLGWNRMEYSKGMSLHFISGLVQSASRVCSAGCRSDGERGLIREPSVRLRALGTVREQTKKLWLLVV